MPLDYSGSKNATKKNFHELYAKLRSSGEIHGYHPPNKEAARKYITAIVMSAKHGRKGKK